MEKIIASFFWKVCQKYFTPLFVESSKSVVNFDVTKAAIYLNKLGSFQLDESEFRNVHSLQIEAEFLAVAACLHKYENTSLILELENCCMFSIEGGGALEMVLDYLKNLQSNKSIPGLWDDANKEKYAALSGVPYPTLWAYLDNERKAVAGFIYDERWHALLFCKSDEEHEAMHWIEKVGFVPVVFKKDIAEYLKNADLGGGFCLKSYLPRDLWDFLSKKKTKHLEIFSEKIPRKSYGKDKGDLL